MASSPRHTVITIDPYTQRTVSRLGRLVSLREANKVADLWESHGTNNVCVIDDRGIIIRQPSTMAANRNRSGRSLTKLKTDGRGYPVFGAAYGKRMQLAKNSFLTHAVDFDAGKVVCGKVKFDNVMEDESMSEPEPSCPTCRKRLGLS